MFNHLDHQIRGCVCVCVHVYMHMYIYICLCGVHVEKTLYFAVSVLDL